MPRILPRLIKRLTEQPLSALVYEGKNIKRTRRVSIYRPIASTPAPNPSRSILLAHVNPITHARQYAPHKRLPPTLQPQKYSRKMDPPREMTTEEKRWWANPYLRMLASPVRLCSYTERHMPNDFLIRLGIMRMPPSLAESNKQFRGKTGLLVPDGLESSKFTVRKAAKAIYIVCWKDAIKLCVEDGGDLYGRALPMPHLVDQIGHLLRVRVLQELELLGDTMAGNSFYQHTSKSNTDGLRRKHAPPTIILRRLTRREFNDIRETGVIPDANALAVIVAPPVNRDPETKERPEGSMSTLPPPPSAPVARKRADLPLWTLNGSNTTSLPAELPPLTEEQIPLYNAASLFPLREQRAALHTALTRILGIERDARAGARKGHYYPGTVKGDEKGSHAFLLCANEYSIRRGDSCAVATALWRLRMFEGGDWDEQRDNGWILRQKYRSVDRFE